MPVRAPINFKKLNDNKKVKIQKAVALRIVQLLADRKMSQYALLKKIAMSKSTLRNIMNEKYDEVKLSTVFKLAEGFDMTVIEFLDSPLFDRDKLIVD